MAEAQRTSMTTIDTARLPVSSFPSERHELGQVLSTERLWSVSEFRLRARDLVSVNLPYVATPSRHLAEQTLPHGSHADISPSQRSGKAYLEAPAIPPLS